MGKKFLNPEITGILHKRGDATSCLRYTKDTEFKMAPSSLIICKLKSEGEGLQVIYVDMRASNNQGGMKKAFSFDGE